MGKAKWIGGILGWVTLGPIGGLLGYFLGKAIDTGMESMTASGGGHTQRGYSAQEQRSSFMVSLLVLSSAVIKADGRVHQKELDFVRSFIAQNFGAGAVEEAMRLLDGFNRQNVNIYEVGPQIARYMNYSQRLQLFHYLTQIAIADSDFSKSEKDLLEVIAGTIGISPADAASVIAMFWKDSSSAYTVLEIKPTATDDEVRSAYRKMAMKYHPDKVATLGADVQKAAADKFRQVQEAYESIKRERGMN